jgi:4-amino-4-deoxy-L-arabinose transferase-like glycosyltransferase
MASNRAGSGVSKSWVGVKRFVFTEHRIISLIVLLGVLLRAWQINWGLPRLYEEAIPFHYGLKFWGLQKSPIDSFFFVYPALTYYLQFVAQAVVFSLGYLTGQYQSVASFLQGVEADPSSLVFAGRLVTVAFDTATLVAAYMFLFRFVGKRAAIFAAALLSVNLLHVSQAHLINVDTPLTFFSVLLLYFLYALHDRPMFKFYLLAGATIGMAAAVKYNAGILVLALVFAHLLRAKSVSEAARSLLDRPLLMGVALAGIIFLLLNPLILTHVDDFLMKFKATEIHMESGHLGIDYGSSTLFYYLFESLPSNLGWILLVVSLTAACYFLVSREKRKYLILITPVLYLILLGSWQMRADRYILPVLPFLVIIASIGIFQFWDYLVKRAEGGPSSGLVKRVNQSPLAFAMVLLVVGFSSIGSVVRYHRSLGLPDTRTVAKEWIEKNLPRGSAIATGPFGIELADTAFLKLPIQFSAVNSERLSAFYDTRWYEDLDLLVASDFDYGRYLQDPQRYADMLGFYDTLRGSWHLASQYAPDESHTGPTIWLYTLDRPTAATSFDPSLLSKLDNPLLEKERKTSFLGKLGLILLVKGEARKSTQCFEKILEIDPENAEAKRALAQVAMLSAEGRGGSDGSTGTDQIQRLEEAASRLLESGRFVEAEKAFLAILRRDRYNHTAYQGLMLVYGYQDDRGKVIGILTKYLEILSPESNDYKLVQQQIDALKSGK